MQSGARCRLRAELSWEGAGHKNKRVSSDPAPVRVLPGAPDTPPALSLVLEGEAATGVAL